jgi:hypothetical protein
MDWETQTLAGYAEAKEETPNLCSILVSVVGVSSTSTRIA